MLTGAAGSIRVMARRLTRKRRSYADDKAIVYQRKKPILVMSKLQMHVDKMPNCFVKWNIANNSDKSKALIQSRRRYRPE